MQSAEIRKVSDCHKLYGERYFRRIAVFAAAAKVNAPGILVQNRYWQSILINEATTAIVSSYLKSIDALGFLGNISVQS